MYYDVFNGDADGICALIQLRLHTPVESRLVTGVKRDIALLQKVAPTEPADITVLDISLEKNRSSVEKLLLAGARMLYFDHHNPGDESIEHQNLSTFIDISPTICTSLLVDHYLEQAFHEWAIVGTFGDNLTQVASSLCQNLNLAPEQSATLNTLGICLNYNGYGATVGDLHFDPADLYRMLIPFKSPFDFMRESPEIWQRLQQGYSDDMNLGLGVAPEYQTDSIAVILLPDSVWARRVNGVLGNELCNRFPYRAHAVITPTPDNDIAVSIRAPLNKRQGADILARQFPTGGGRKGAAGINHLPVSDLPRFIDAMEKQFG